MNLPNLCASVVIMLSWVGVNQGLKMPLFCYCSEILPGKADVIRRYWKNKKENEDPSFWESMKMVGFESFLQDHFLIHCLEGESIETIFKGLRENIAKAQPNALGVQKLYLEALGKDYSKVDVEPKIECLFDMTLEKPASFVKRGFVFPLRPEKEEAHRQFRKEAMTNQKKLHEASLRAFSVYKMSVWLQQAKEKKYLVIYQERAPVPKTARERLSIGNHCLEWKEISTILMDHTGLTINELSPDVEWLTS